MEFPEESGQGGSGNQGGNNNSGNQDSKKEDDDDNLFNWEVRTTTMINCKI